MSRFVPIAVVTLDSARSGARRSTGACACGGVGRGDDVTGRGAGGRGGGWETGGA
jgi:hypothetical protein